MQPRLLVLALLGLWAAAAAIAWRASLLQEAATEMLRHRGGTELAWLKRVRDPFCARSMSLVRAHAVIS